MQQEDDQQNFSKKTFSETNDPAANNASTPKKPKNAESQTDSINTHFFIQNLSTIHQQLLQPLLIFNNRAVYLENKNNEFFFQIGNSDLDLQDNFMEIFQNLKDDISQAIADFNPLLNSTFKEIDYCIEKIKNILTLKSITEETFILLNKKMDAFINLKEKSVLLLRFLEMYSEDLDILLTAINYNEESIKDESPHAYNHNIGEITDHFYGLLSSKCKKSHAEIMNILTNKDTRTLIIKLSSILDSSDTPAWENKIITAVLEGCISRIRKMNPPIAIHLRRK